jgi:hypothetical protein
MESMSLGSVPYDENCVQVGQNNYSQLYRIESQLFIAQLYRILDEKFKERLITLRLKGSPHDSGTYHEVYVNYDPDNSLSVEQAFWLDSNVPERWDETAMNDMPANYKEWLQNSNQVTCDDELPY